MSTLDAATARGHTGEGRPAFRRSTRTKRGEARRHDLLTRVSDDLAEHGLVGFSLRRAARVAGTTHKVLLYHFDSAEDLLAQAMTQLRDRRIVGGLEVANAAETHRTLSERVRAIWPVIVDSDSRVLDQAIGLALFDGSRYSGLGRDASRQYLPSLLSMCPEHWEESRKVEVSEMILGALRGFLIDWRLSEGTSDSSRAGLEALTRALDREERAEG